MNRMTKSQLTGVVVVLLLANSLLGCTCNQCLIGCTDFCLGLDDPSSAQNCIFPCVFVWCPIACTGTEANQTCTDNSDERAAMYEYYQDAAIQICEEYPEECQEAFDTYIESLDEEDTE